MRPTREHATNNDQTYFVSSQTWGRRALFRTEPWTRLFFKTLLSHRGSAYLLHEFVLMPDHFHLLITPRTSLERAMQFIKGGFSYRAKKDLRSSMEVWQAGFTDHRIRDAEDYEKHVKYILLNPVKAHLANRPSDYPYCSAYPGWKLDPIPQRLKPGVGSALNGGPEGSPLQSAHGEAEGDGPPLPSVAKEGQHEGPGTAEAVPLQDSPKEEVSSDTEEELEPQPK